MAQKEQMIQALKTYVIPGLRERGFQGSYPHFRRKTPQCIELLSFMRNKWGNSFTVEVSYVIPGRDDVGSNYLNIHRSQHNLLLPEDEKTVNVWNTNLRYRLKGQDGCWFYDSDVYISYYRPFHKWIYHAVPEGEAKTYRKKWNEIKIQTAGKAACKRVCSLVNRRLDDAWKWLEEQVSNNAKDCSL